MKSNDLVQGMLKLRAVTTKYISSGYGNVPVGSEITIHLIGKDYALSHGKDSYLPSVYHDEYELIDQPEHQCTNNKPDNQYRCGNKFTLVGRDTCPTCGSKVRKL